MLLAAPHTGSRRTGPVWALGTLFFRPMKQHHSLALLVKGIEFIEPENSGMLMCGFEPHASYSCFGIVEMPASLMKM